MQTLTALFNLVILTTAWAEFLELPEEILPNKTTCGFESEDRRIIGGELTELGEFPWLVALQYLTKYDHRNGGIRCGATLISKKFLLTAGHCIIQQDYKLYRAWLGEWKLSTNPDCITYIAYTECADPVKKIKISLEIPHPDYVSHADNDIGLLRLAEDVEYTDYIRPICLPTEGVPYPEIATLMTVAGWGATEESASSDVKLKVQLPLQPNSKCNDKLFKKISSNQLCAGGIKSEDSCFGDSGGPLMRNIKPKRRGKFQWYIDGVVSWGEGCGSADVPAVYTNVSKYMDWILKTVKANIQL